MSIWHYPRTALAKKILNGMNNGLIERVSIFAPRKRGKTQFIQHDIVPMCYQNGIMPIYVDFWQNQASPDDVFCNAVTSAIEQNKPLLSRFLGNLRLDKFSLSPLKPIPDISISSNHAQSVNPSLLQVMKMLDQVDGKILLLLDEVQHLGTRPEFLNFVAGLRSFMVNRPDSKVKGIFTGSSREGLNQLFKNSKAPFFNSAEVMDFPDFGHDFVTFECDVFKTVTTHSLNVEEALKVFISQKRSPQRFVEMLKKMAVESVYDLQEGARLYDPDNRDRDLAFEKQINEISSIEIALLKLIAANQDRGLYTPKGLLRVIAFIDDPREQVSKSSINNALAKLRDAGLIYSPKRGQRIIEDPEFKDYLLQKH